MQSTSIVEKFKEICLRKLDKLPELYILSFIKEQHLMMDLSQLKTKDFKQIEILLFLPFKKMTIFSSTETLQKQLTWTKQNPSNQQLLKTKTKQTQKLSLIIEYLNIILCDSSSNYLKVLKFSHISFQQKNIESILQGIQKAKYLKELAFIKCQLKDSHIEILKKSLITNVSLTSLDFSYNQLKDCGGIIGKVLSEHSKRRNCIVNLLNTKNINPKFNVGNTGLCQINLEGNQLSQKSIEDFITFLHDDEWIRSINLKKNKISKESVSKLTQFLSNNSTIINLDLRQNEGMTKHYSKLIFDILKQNLLKFKNCDRRQTPFESPKKKNILQGSLLAQPTDEGLLQANLVNESFIKQKSLKLQNRLSADSLLKFNKQKFQDQQGKKIIQQKSQQNIFLTSKQKEYQTSKNNVQKKINNQEKHRDLLVRVEEKFSESKKSKQISLINTPKLSLKKSKSKNECHIPQNEHIQHYSCKNCLSIQLKLLKSEQKCHQWQIRALNAEKQNIELQLQHRKLRHFLTKNADMSAILSSSNRITAQNPPQLNIPNSNISTSFNKLIPVDGQDQMISKIQILISELSKIMQTVEQFQNTENTILQGFQNVNSFSKTVSLYEKPTQLAQIHQEILQDEALHLEQFAQNSLSLIEKSSSDRAFLIKNNNQ